MITRLPILDQTLNFFLAFIFHNLTTLTFPLVLEHKITTFYTQYDLTWSYPQLQVSFMSTMHLTQSTYNNFRTHNNLHTNSIKTPPAKTSATASRRLAETHHCQAIQPKQEQSHATDESPGGTG